MDFRSLSPATQSAFRRRAAVMIAEGASNRGIASAFGIHPGSVTLWRRHIREHGVESFVEDARARTNGKAPMITPAEQELLSKTIETSLPDAHGLDFVLWTREAVCALSARLIGKPMKRRTMNDYLLKWGFTPQVPVSRAYEQKPEAIRQWVEVDYPAIEQRALAENALILWCDETGISNQANVCRGYAREGETPELPRPAKRVTRSVISAISNKGDMRWMVYKGAIKADLLLKFLGRLIRSVEGRKIVLIWDNLRVHKAAKVREWVDARKESIELAYLPPYAPQYQPDERLNRALKGDLARRPICATETGSVTRIKSALLAIARTKGRVTGLFSGPLVSYAAAK